VPDDEGCIRFEKILKQINSIEKVKIDNFIDILI